MEDQDSKALLKLMRMMMMITRVVMGEDDDKDGASSSNAMSAATMTNTTSASSADFSEESSSNGNLPLAEMEQHNPGIDCGDGDDASDDATAGERQNVKFHQPIGILRFYRPKKFLSTVPMDRGKKDTTAKKFVHSDPLDWWKIHENKFPNLGVLARKFLAIQAGSAPSERIFSQASLLISDKRTRLDPKIAGKALFVKQNWELFEEELNYLKIIGGKDVEKFFKELEELEGEESENEED